MRLVDYQFYPTWRTSFKKTQNSYQDRAWNEYWICTGPLQTRWAGKSWCTHLRRSPEYIAQVKQLLLTELETVKFK